jgi:hypothetical protein
VWETSAVHLPMKETVPPSTTALVDWRLQEGTHASLLNGLAHISEWVAVVLCAAPRMSTVHVEPGWLPGTLECGTTNYQQSESCIAPSSKRMGSSDAIMIVQPEGTRALGALARMMLSCPARLVARPYIAMRYRNAVQSVDPCRRPTCRLLKYVQWGPAQRTSNVFISSYASRV